MVKPKDQRVGMNGLAQFECVAEGNPPPSVFWSKEGSQVSLRRVAQKVAVLKRDELKSNNDRKGVPKK